MGIRIYSTADIIYREWYAGSGSYIRIQPTDSWSWGL
jgi:hypothetical protein